jgi:hypothetical protein
LGEARTPDDGTKGKIIGPMKCGDHLSAVGAR